MLHTDLHIHTRYDHGHGEPVDFVQEALSRGVTGIGILGHSRCSFPIHYSMNQEGQDTLYKLTTRLKETYQDRLNIFRGMEIDYFCPNDWNQSHHYDYTIGSVHYIRTGNEYTAVDSKLSYIKEATSKYYDGDFRCFVTEYYRTVADVINVTGADIVGHFDLISKFNEFTPFYDEQDSIVRNAALTAIEKLAKQNPIFEINSGAISRGNRTVPYPAKWLLEALHDMGGRIIFSSDAHRPSDIFFSFDQSIALARKCGFTTAWRLTPQGFCEYTL